MRAWPRPSRGSFPCLGLLRLRIIVRTIGPGALARGGRRAAPGTCVRCVIVLLWLALHALALFGWGRGVGRALRLPVYAAPLSAAVGLAWVVVLGGVLNLGAWAVRPSQWIVLGAGLALAALELRRLRWSVLREKPRALTLMAACVWTLSVVACAASVFPTPTFNYHDDYQKYFAHAARLLQTGSVAGSSLSAIGFETLGGQAFLHTFVLNVAGFDMLNAVDVGLGLSLCLAIAGFGPTHRRHEACARLVAMAALLLVHPQIVNISALFTGAALIMALLAIDLQGPLQLRQALLAGMMLAALLALKTSFLPLTAALLGALSGARCALVFASAQSSLPSVIARSAQRRALADAAKFLGVCGASTLLFVSPWLGVHAHSYLAALHAQHAPRSDWPRGAYTIELWSWEKFDYGIAFAPYTLAVLGSLALATFAFACARKDREQRWSWASALTWSGALLVMYAAMLYAIGPISQGELTALRLFVPSLLGVWPIVILAAARAVSTQPRARVLMAGALAIAPLLPFVPSALERAWQAIARGTVLAFSELDQKPWYRAYNDDVLRGAMQNRVRDAERQVPASEPLVAWVDAPFWLDFRRGRVTDLDLAGLETPWARIPDARYVIWDFGSAATPQLPGLDFERKASGLLQARIADDGLRLTRALLSLNERSQVIWNDGALLVMRLPSPSALREAYEAQR